MADGNGKRIGAVVGPGVTLEGKDAAHHIDDLPLIRPARAHDSLLHLHRRILPQLHASLGAGDDRSPPRLGRRDGGA